MGEMKTLNGHEIVDAKARKKLDEIEQNGVGGEAVLSSGSLVIKPTDWTDVTPYTSLLVVKGLDNGQVVLIMPADDLTKEEAGKARISVQISYTDETVDTVQMIKAEASYIPQSDLNFRYVVLGTGTEEEALAALVGVAAPPAAKGTHIEIVSLLPELSQADLKAIYVVPFDGEGDDLYREYVCIEAEEGNVESRAWEPIGTGALDIQLEKEIHVMGGTFQDGYTMQIVTDGALEYLYVTVVLPPDGSCTTSGVSNLSPADKFEDGKLTRMYLLQKRMAFYDAIIPSEGYEIADFEVIAEVEEGWNVGQLYQPDEYTGSFRAENFTGDLTITIRRKEESQNV